MNKHELKKIRDWWIVLLYTLFLYISLPVMPGLWERFSQKLGNFADYLAALMLGSIGLFIIFYFVSKRKSIQKFIWLAILASTYAWGLTRLKLPIERMHFIEYGLLAFLVFRALRHSIKDSSLYLCSGIAVFCLGVLDEGIQYILPNRVFESRDVLVNGASGILMLLLVRLCQYDKEKIHKILVIRTDRIGETLLNIPAIRALKQSFNSFIVALVNPAVKELFAGTPEIDQFLTFDEENWNKSIFARLNLFRQLRKGKFDLAVILNPAKKFHILTYLTGIPRRLGYNRKWGYLLTHKIEDSKFLGEKHEVEYNLDLVRSIGADTDNKDISIKVEKKDIQLTEDLLAKNAVSLKDLIIAIHPASSNPAKCWPGENFASLADGLQAKFSAKVAIIGGPEERSSAKEMISLAKYPAINLCGKLTLKQLAAFFQRCALLISNDSGPVHIAAAMGTPCVVIFGRNIPGVGPRRWGPWGKGHMVLNKDPGCNPCLDRDCPYDFKCLRSIGPKEALVAAEKQINEKMKICT